MDDKALEQIQARHRKEQRDLQSRITSKKKNATKKTRKFVNNECAELERQLKERQAAELASLTPPPTTDDEDQDPPEETTTTVNGDLAVRLENTTISPAADPEQPAQQEKGGGKTKRNRQKERLARRAAELEAAAIKAESEAVNMTDHRGIERTYMLSQFAAHALTEKEIEPDGHCLFSAVADQLVANDIPLTATTEGKMAPDYKIVRRAAAGYMASHADDFSAFLVDETLDEHVVKIRDTAEWGGQLELTALANFYKVEIKVVQADGRTESIKPETEKELKTLWLAFYRHGYGLGEHYNSLRPKAATTVVAAAA
ncbi:OTU-like cysteine protease [Apodospora peruviana]|uniref:OTU-like cysteine protease n=1 Tax=Apodospora peruviana TaxID=516989 RepID=A0AAE0MBS6_9PEZI|nr:OTU-like cysteine protease [Apodospora peruviana]